MRALFSGVTGIRSHQVRMDVIGNNIANVNTNGFKSSRVTFQDVMSQTLSAGSANTAPQQVGLGVGIGSIDVNHGAGSLQMTGRELDLALEGNGMFILKGTAAQPQYTRVGNFDWDSQGFLVNPATGAKVQGWAADAAGEFGSLDAGSMADIKVVKGGVALADPTSKATFGGNLDANAAEKTKVRTTMTAYDTLGRPQFVKVVFTKTATANEWKWGVEEAPAAADPTAPAPAPDPTAPAPAAPAEPTITEIGTLKFKADGTLAPATGTDIRQVELTDATDPTAAKQKVTVNFDAITQAYAGTSGSSVLVREANGYPMGTLESVTVDTSGQVYGVYTNNTRRALAQLAVANFANTAGLLKSGSTAFTESAASGTPVVGTPGTGDRGRLLAGNLEMSNVDLSTEFTNMIMTQRGFQANTKIITAADELLQDLVNLKR